jgi:hypothetical protein
MIQIPKSKILENQYTNGTGIGKNIALRSVSSKIPYVGFYVVVNGNKYFSGKQYNDRSRPLERYNILALAASAVAAAGSIAVKNDSLVGVSTTRYFYKDLTKTDITIKEIDKNAYNELVGKNSMTYQVISYNPQTQNLIEVNNQMPGLIAFLGA